MANKICAFCGKELGIFDRNTLLVGNTSQPACKDCWNQLFDLSQEERARRALESGRPADPEALRSFLEAEEARRQAQQEERRRKYATDLTCLRCGGEMFRYGHKLIPLGDEGLLGPVLRDGFLTPWMEVDILRCEQCGRAEFFLESPPPPPPEPEEEVTCPVCGARHSPLVNCPRCAMRGAVDRQQPRTEDAPREPKRRGQKPPWEK